MKKIKCIFMEELTVPSLLPNGESQSDNNSVLYPEKELSIKEQQAFEPENYIEDGVEEFYIVTNSPFIVSCFKSRDVYIKNPDGEGFVNPEKEVYGASYDSILTSLVGLKVLIADKPLVEIKSILLDYDEKGASAEDTLKKLEKFGESFELNYRRNQLKMKID